MWISRGACWVDRARRSEQLEQKVFVVTTGGGGEFSNERLDRERVWDVGDSAKPTDACVRGGYISGPIYAKIGPQLHRLVADRILIVAELQPG